MLAHRASLACLLALTACGDPASGDDVETDAGSSSTADEPTSTTAASSSSSTGSESTTEETSTSTSTASDETGSTTPEETCDGFVPGASFEIAADVSTTRIHPHAAGDATGAWFSFVHPEPAGSLFDVSVMHLRCADDIDVPPQLANTEPGNDIDASVAVFDDRVLVVWNTDDGQGGDSNLQIHARIYDDTGTPVAPSQLRVTTSVEGTPITGNHTFGVVTATPGGFAVAGLRAHPDSPAFVAFAQAIDSDGALSGEAFGAPVEGGVSHLLASSSDGWLAYGRSDADTDQVFVVHPDVEAAAAFDGVTAGGGQVLARSEGAPIVAGTIGEGNAIDVGLSVGTGPALLLGEPGAIEHSPTVAASPDGALAVVYHRNLGGLNNAVIFQRLRLEGETLMPDGEAVELDTMSPPYPPSITWTPGGWLVTWSRGQSPDFATWGQVLAPR